MGSRVGSVDVRYLDEWKGVGSTNGNGLSVPSVPSFSVPSIPPIASIQVSQAQTLHTKDINTRSNILSIPSSSHVNYTP